MYDMAHIFADIPPFPDVPGVSRVLPANYMQYPGNGAREREALLPPGSKMFFSMITSGQPRHYLLQLVLSCVSRIP